MTDKEPFTFLNSPWWNQEQADDDAVDDSPPSDVVDDEFQALVNAAYETLPPKIRALPDFPPIEILDEAPQPKPGNEILGRFFGLSRRQPRSLTVVHTPTVIHIYRAPIMRYARRRGMQIPDVVKTTVWHEVAHWLGFQSEEEVAELGLT